MLKIKFLICLWDKLRSTDEQIIFIWIIWQKIDFLKHLERFFQYDQSSTYVVHLTIECMILFSTFFIPDQLVLINVDDDSVVA